MIKIYNIFNILDNAIKLKTDISREKIEKYLDILDKNYIEYKYFSVGIIYLINKKYKIEKENIIWLIISILITDTYNFEINVNTSIMNSNEECNIICENIINLDYFYNSYDKKILLDFLVNAKNIKKITYYGKYYIFTLYYLNLLHNKYNKYNNFFDYFEANVSSAIWFKKELFKYKYWTPLKKIWIYLCIRKNLLIY